jgi:hypothetical protein
MEAIELIKDAQGVEYAEPNWIYNHFAVSMTLITLMVHFGACTDLQLSIKSICHNAAAWANKLGSATVYIGIIDEGYMYTHEDLAANAGKTQEK